MTAAASSSAACRGLISSLSSTLQLTSGHPMPIVGFGVYQNRGEGCYSACLEALKAGYRHIDSARAYRCAERASVRERLADRRARLILSSPVLRLTLDYA